jgi:hypothetical protein
MNFRQYTFHKDQRTGASSNYLLALTYCILRIFSIYSDFLSWWWWPKFGGKLYLIFEKIVESKSLLERHNIVAKSSFQVTLIGIVEEILQ